MDSEEDMDKNKLSEVVSDILKCNGYCKNKLEVLRSVCLLSEKIVYDLHGATEIKCGSALAEGSEVVGSDIDFMTVVPEIIAVNENCDLFSNKMHIFTMKLDKGLHGYTRLQVHTLNQNRILDSDIQSMVVKDGNKFFLSTEEFLKPLKNKIGNVRENASLKYHGPSISHSLYYLYTKFEFDTTFGIKCHSWPVADDEWKNRPRSKGWPSKEIVDVITTFPVHVMPIVDEKSNYPSMQWRFAFSKAERELIWSFNKIQFQCYVLIKCIFKGKLQPFSPDELSVYQIKNLLFWISEDYGVEMFNKANLLHCIEICLDRFKQHILRGSLPHYIIPDRDLLKGKLDSKTQQRIADEIDKNLEDIFVTIVECRHILPPDNFLNMYNGSKKNFVCQIKAPLNNGLVLRKKTKHLYSMRECKRLCFEMVSRPNINMENVFALIGDISLGKNISHTILPYVLKTAARFGSILFGMMITVYLNEMNITSEEIEYIVKFSSISFKKGFDLDELSGKLYSVTFALLNNNIDAASEILSRIMYNTKPFHFHGWKTKNNEKRFLQLSNSEISDFDYVDVNNDVSVSHEVFFPVNVLHFVPEPIKYELSLLQCTGSPCFCVYDPLLYALYLMFEITRKRNEQMTKILRKLINFIENYAGDIGDRYRACNLLGYCLYVCGLRDEAIFTFGRSMQDKTDSTNAAVYHLCIILSKYVANKAAVV
ncbi:Hypothetical predicted protein [Mytilus galloprovincialis]|uniref:Mab-21-like HhH/H2TH-like domain-containing protein n=1 Tax=Mytilus galloprovincialis TaxID=29158 RepID=A0A8B6GDC3_MYTGA|nr:Hypothetical predicted protein [Mytilus galloprovincialis]